MNPRVKTHAGRRLYAGLCAEGGRGLPGPPLPPPRAPLSVLPLGFRRPCLGLMSLLLLAAFDLRAQAPAPRAPAPQIFLFVVDTSRAMAGMNEAVQLAVADLIERGLGGRMRRDDLFAIWTFNEKVETGGFLPQRWDPERARPISNQAFLFLKRQSWGRASRLSPALAEILRAVLTTENLTVYLVSDGHEPLRGTPFDAAINAVYQQHSRDWQRDKTPAVTALVAQHGKIVDWAVGVADPPTPVQTLAAQPVPADPVKTNVVSPAPAPKPPPNVVVAKTNTSPPTPVITKPPALVAKPAGEPPKPTVVAPSPPPQVSADPIKPKTNLMVSAPEIAKALPSGETSKVVPKPVVQSPPPDVTVLRSTNAPPSLPANSKASIRPPSSISGEAKTVGNSTTETVPAAKAQTNPPLPAGTSNLVAKDAEPKVAPAALPSPGGASNPVIVQTVAALPPPSASGPHTLLIAGLVLLVTGGGLSWIWMRRAHAQPQPSLITRGMDRSGK